MPTNWAELEWFEIMRLFSPFVPVKERHLLCDWGMYWAAVCCGIGSVMTAGLVLGGWCGKLSGWVGSSHPQTLAQSFW